MLKVRVLRELPHDPSAFTQGLLLHEGWVYESTGHYGQSTLRRWSLTTGEVLQRVELGPGLFGEGLALVEGRLIQLTWRRGRAMVYDLASFRKLSAFEYAGEGWGLTFDGTAIVMSDGSDTLTFRDPESFRPLRHMRVSLRGRRLRNLNELEWASGSIYANVWMEDWIARIDPATGEVTGVIDASGLLTASERAKADVLNGIAHDQETGRFVITGKLWPKAFEVELVPATER